MDNYGYQPDDNNGKPFAITRYPSAPGRPGNYLVEINSRFKFFRHPRLYKTLTAILAILVVLLLIIIIVLTVFYCMKYHQTRICTSEECLRSAANLHSSLDLSTDPCDDFYQYSCGRWSKEHPNHGWFPSFSSFATITERVMIATEEFLTSEEEQNEPVAVKQARDFYKSCIDTESLDNLGLSVIYKYLKEADLPLIPSLVNENQVELGEFKFDWLKADAAIKKTFAMDVLIGFSVDANLYNRSENVMYVGVPEETCPLPSPAKKNAQRGEGFPELRRQANENIVRFVLTTIITNVTSQAPKSDVLLEATDVLLNMTYRINELIGNYSDPSDELFYQSVRDYQNETNKFLRSAIDKEYPQIWEKYIAHLFDGLDVRVDFDQDYLYFSEADREYLPRILTYVLTTSDVYLELYMWWVTVFAMIINTSSDIVEYLLKQTAPFYTGASVLRSRSLDCSVLVNNFMGMAVSYGLADKTFSNKTKPKVEQMLHHIKNAFIGQVNNLAWMDKETKEATLEKSKEMISFIGYPDWLFKDGTLDIYYKSVSIKNDTFLDNMMSFTKNYIPSQLENLRKLNARNWTTDPTVVNAFNSFPDNSINVPMAILTFPVYDLGLEVLNYGAIGTILGHELTHGFDNTGRKYDKFGNYIEWWTNATIRTFEEKIDCFVRQYDNFTISGIPAHVQGKKTLGENIADNGGLSHAYNAYQHFSQRHGPEAKLPGFENFTQDQLFFIAFGSIWCQTIALDDLENDLETDVHSPNSVRVIGSLQNSQEFARAFRCPVGSRMNPTDNKCKVW